MSPRRRSRAWVGFFVALTLLAGAAVTLEVWYNVHQQLTPEALAAARRLWQAKGPADYDLKYLVSLQSREGERLTGRVHDGTLKNVTVNGEPLDPVLYAFHDLTPLLEQAASAEGEREVSGAAPEQARAVVEVQVRGGRAVGGSCNGWPLPRDGAGPYDMAGLFAGIARLVDQDEHAGAWRPYVVATFDKKDGHLVHFVHSRMRARERVEIQVGEVTPPGQAPTSR